MGIWPDADKPADSKPLDSAKCPLPREEALPSQSEEVSLPFPELPAMVYPEVVARGH